MTNTHFSRSERGEEPSETLGFIHSPTTKLDPRSQALDSAAVAAENHRSIVARIPETLQADVDAVLGTDGRNFVYLVGLMGALERGSVFGDTDLSTFTMQAVLDQRKIHMLHANSEVRQATIAIERSFGIDLEHADPNGTLNIQNVNSALAHDLQKYLATKTDFLWAMADVRRYTEDILHTGTSDVSQQAA